jgi:hypothetical protein
MINRSLVSTPGSQSWQGEGGCPRLIRKLPGEVLIVFITFTSSRSSHRKQRARPHQYESIFDTKVQFFFTPNF